MNNEYAYLRLVELRLELKKMMNNLTNAHAFDPGSRMLEIMDEMNSILIEAFKNLHQIEQKSCVEVVVKCNSSRVHGLCDILQHYEYDYVVGEPKILTQSKDE